MRARRANDLFCTRCDVGSRALAPCCLCLFGPANARFSVFVASNETTTLRLQLPNPLMHMRRATVTCRYRVEWARSFFLVPTYISSSFFYNMLILLLLLLSVVSFHFIPCLAKRENITSSSPSWSCRRHPFVKQWCGAALQMWSGPQPHIYWYMAIYGDVEPFRPVGSSALERNKYYEWQRPRRRATKNLPYTRNIPLAGIGALSYAGKHVVALIRTRNKRIRKP